MLFGIVILLGAVAFVTACTPLSLLNAVIPTDGFARTADISYAPGDRHKLDVYVPKSTGFTTAPKPVIVFLYGGNWQSGQRQDYLFAGEAFTSQGFVTVVPDYRIYPEVRFPDFVFDAALAVRWVKDHIADYGGDPQRVSLVGHSAGAHIAALLALDPQYLRSVAMIPAELHAMVGIAGPYDFLPLKSEALKMIFGPEAQRNLSQPINFVAGNNPPILLLVGQRDSTVNPGNTRRLSAKIGERGGPVRTIEYPDYGHTDIIGAIAAPLRSNASVLGDIAAFLNAAGA